MLIIVPIALLLVAAVVIRIINSVKPNFSTTWLIAAGATFSAWLVISGLRLYLPSTVNLIGWQPEVLFHASPKLLLDYQTWPYALSLVTLCMAVIFTDSARTRTESSPVTWAGSLAITSIGLLALLAGDPLTMVMAWAFVDLIELVYLLSTQDSDVFYPRIILFYGIRLLSIIMFIWATMVGWLDAGSFDLTTIPARSGMYFLIAAGLRLGVLPLNLPFLNEPELKRGAGTLLRLAPVASSLSVISRLPENAFTIRPNWVLPLQAMTALAAIYSAGMWATRADETEARPYWIVSLASFGIACAINGQAEASRAWGVALLLSGSMLFLFYPRIKRMRFLLFTGLIGLVALPFTPSATGWQGLIGQGFNFWSAVMILAHALLVLGYLRYILTASDAATGLETWARIIYPLGLIFTFQTHVAIGLIGWPGVFTVGLWWGGLASLLITILALILVWRLGLIPPYFFLPEGGKSFVLIRKVLPLIEDFFRLDWAYRLVWSIYTLFGKLMVTIIAILEGEGGVLWALLLLVLLITVLFSMGGT